MSGFDQTFDPGVAAELKRRGDAVNQKLLYNL